MGVIPIIVGRIYNEYPRPCGIQSNLVNSIEKLKEGNKKKLNCDHVSKDIPLSMATNFIMSLSSSSSGKVGKLNRCAEELNLFIFYNEITIRKTRVSKKIGLPH